jgi:hypothetical protein
MAVFPLCKISALRQRRAQHTIITYLFMTLSKTFAFPHGPIDCGLFLAVLRLLTAFNLIKLTVNFRNKNKAVYQLQKVNFTNRKIKPIFKLEDHWLELNYCTLSDLLKFLNIKN